MAVFILTWNPSMSTISDDECQRRVETTARGLEHPGKWSTGTRNHGIAFGDRAFLLRQHMDRGIVAAGTFTSEIFPDDHWDGSDRQANYAFVAWTTWLDVDDRLPIDVLKLRVPGVAWDRLQGSGIKLRDEDATLVGDLWARHLGQVGWSVSSGPDEVSPSDGYREGAVTRVSVNRYERDQRARAAAIAKHGLGCVVCGFNFEDAYGPLGADFIHVHHVQELSTLPEGYVVDPDVDLVPVCPNCHAMLHRKRPALTIDELRAVLDT